MKLYTAEEIKVLIERLCNFKPDPKNERQNVEFIQTFQSVAEIIDKFLTRQEMINDMQKNGFKFLGLFGGDE